MSMITERQCPRCDAKFVREKGKCTSRELYYHLARYHGIPWKEARKMIWGKKEESNMDVSKSNSDAMKLLEDIRNDIKGLGDRISKLEDGSPPKSEVKTEVKTDPQPDNQTSSDSKEAAMADQILQENQRLRQDIAQLSSPEHEQRLIRDWLMGLDQENFITLGVKLGHLEEAEPEDPEAVQEPQETELEDGGQKFVLTREKPADMTGWAYSEALGMYARVK